MITKEEYLKACEIVVTYNLLNVKNELNIKTRKTVKEWNYDTRADRSARLGNVLKNYFEYMDEIPLNRHLLRGLRNTGPSLIDEFFDLIKKYPY